VCLKKTEITKLQKKGERVSAISCSQRSNWCTVVNLSSKFHPDLFIVPHRKARNCGTSPQIEIRLLDVSDTDATWPATRSRRNSTCSSVTRRRLRLSPTRRRRQPPPACTAAEAGAEAARRAVWAAGRAPRRPLAAR